MRIQVELTADEYQRLRDAAERERRTLKLQASWLLTRALETEDQGNDLCVYGKAAPDRKEAP